MNIPLNDSTFAIRISIHPNAKAAFLHWQSEFRAEISQAQGFSSLEILSQGNTWILNFKFTSKESLTSWLQSKNYEELLQQIGSFHAIIQKIYDPHSNGVTEIFVTIVDKKNVEKFHQWHKKIHQIESTFPGFEKIYFQAPNPENKEGAWITLLQFDTLANLERWLNSSERKEILKESEDFVISKETHQLLSPYESWFSNNTLSSPVWKQTMLLLAVLFPIVMMQYLYLAPYLNSIELSLKTFLENMISVTLMSWPLLPIAIYAMKWWLEAKQNLAKECFGIAVLILVYSVEIILFWKLSSAGI